MMNRILGRHPAVVALNELHFFGDLYDPMDSAERWTRETAIVYAASLVARINHGIWNDEPQTADKHVATQIIDESKDDTWCPSDVYERVLERQVERGNGKFVTDQTPRNIYYAEKLLERYKNAVVVHMIRDPRAVVYSQRRRWRKPLVGNKGMPVIEVIRSLFNYHPWTMAYLWKKAIRLDCQLQGHPRYISVVFEELVAKPERVISMICQLIGMDFRQDLLNVKQIGSSHKRDCSEKRGISSRTKDAWRSGLPKGDLMLVEHITASMLNRYGFKRVGIRRNILQVLPALLLFPLHIFGIALTNPARGWIHLKALTNLSRFKF